MYLNNIFQRMFRCLFVHSKYTELLPFSIVPSNFEDN